MTERSLHPTRQPYLTENILSGKWEEECRINSLPSSGGIESYPVSFSVRNTGHYRDVWEGTDSGSRPEIPSTQGAERRTDE